MLRRAARQLFSLPTLLTVLVLIAAELLLRWLGLPVIPDEALLQPDPFVLWEMAPGVRHEAGSEVHVNSLGLRGPELIEPKPAGVRRFLTLGDSSIYGFGVEDDEVFSSVAVRRLGAGVEAVNGGVGGYSTFQAIRLLQRVGRRVDPDLLVVGALWSDNSFDSFVDREVLEEAGARVTEERVHEVHRLFSRSALFRMLDRALRAERQEAAAPARPVRWMLGQGQATGRRRVEINDYAANLERLVTLGDDLGAETLFVMPANRDDIAQPGIQRSWQTYRDVMRDTARRHGSPVIDVLEVFLASGLDGGKLFWDAMHPTAEGHRQIGEALAALLRARRWAEGGSVKTGPDEAVTSSDGKAGAGSSDGRTVATGDEATGSGIPHYVDPFVHEDGSQRGVEGVPAGQAGSSSTDGLAVSATAVQAGSSPPDGTARSAIGVQAGSSTADGTARSAIGVQAGSSPPDGTARSATTVQSDSSPAGPPGSSSQPPPADANTGPPAPPPRRIRPNLRGEVRSSRPLPPGLQIDALDTDRRIVASTRLSGSAAFAMSVQKDATVYLRVLVDLTGNGPDLGDTMIDLSGYPLSLGGRELEGVVVDLDSRTVLTTP